MNMEEPTTEDESKEKNTKNPNFIHSNVQEHCCYPVTKVDYGGKGYKFTGPGIGVAMAAIFIVSEICGSGTLAMSQAMKQSGWIGIAMIILFGLLSSYTGSLLGKCWNILCERYPEECAHSRVFDPYPTIAFKAAGKVGQIATRICIDVTLFGAGVVYVLLIAENAAALILLYTNSNLDFCYWILITGGVLIPISWLGTPKDLWHVGIIAFVTVAVACVLIVIACIMDIPNQPPVHHSAPTVSSFFLAYGTILFAYGGASCYPTIQVDMRQPEKFPMAVIIGISAVFCLYFPVTMAGFLVYGDNIEANIIASIPKDALSTTINILITIHLLVAYNVNINPVAQEIEGFLGIEDKFSLKRVITRTIMTAVVTFVGLTIPRFDILLSLVGGTTIAAVNYIFPPLFYLLLSRQTKPEIKIKKIEKENAPLLPKINEVSEDEERECMEEIHDKEWRKIEIPLYVKAIVYEVIVVGSIGILSSTFFAFKSIIDGSSGFTVPCYLNMSLT